MQINFIQSEIKTLKIRVSVAIKILTFGVWQFILGKEIKKEVKRKGIKITEFAEMINYSRRNIYEIFERKSIDTNLLQKTGKVLGTNLFIHFFSEKELNELKTQKSNEENLKKIIIELKTKIEKKKVS